MRDGSRLDPVERLIDAWLRWERNRGSPIAASERQAAIEALGLPAIDTQRRIADARREGYDVPSAVQRVVLDLRGKAGPERDPLARARAVLAAAPEVEHDHRGPDPCPRCGGLPPEPAPVTSFHPRRIKEIK
jgi:hypothetical protein